MQVSSEAGLKSSAGVTSSVYLGIEGAGLIRSHSHKLSLSLLSRVSPQKCCLSLSCCFAALKMQQRGEGGGGGGGEG